MSDIDNLRHWKRSDWGSSNDGDEPSLRDKAIDSLQSQSPEYLIAQLKQVYKKYNKDEWELIESGLFEALLRSDQGFYKYIQSVGIGLDTFPNSIGEYITDEREEIIVAEVRERVQSNRRIGYLSVWFRQCNSPAANELRQEIMSSGKYSQNAKEEDFNKFRREIISQLAREGNSDATAIIETTSLASLDEGELEALAEHSCTRRLYNEVKHNYASHSLLARKKDSYYNSIAADRRKRILEKCVSCLAKKNSNDETFSWLVSLLYDPEVHYAAREALSLCLNKNSKFRDTLFEDAVKGDFNAAIALKIHLSHLYNEEASASTFLEEPFEFIIRDKKLAKDVRSLFSSDPTKNYSGQISYPASYPDVLSAVYHFWMASEENRASVRPQLIVAVELWLKKHAEEKKRKEDWEAFLNAGFKSLERISIGTYLGGALGMLFCLLAWGKLWMVALGFAVGALVGRAIGRSCAPKIYWKLKPQFPDTDLRAHMKNRMKRV